MSIDQTTVTDQDKLINVNYEGKKKNPADGDYETYH